MAKVLQKVLLLHIMFFEGPFTTKRRNLHFLGHLAFSLQVVFQHFLVLHCLFFLLFFCNYGMICIYMFFLSSYTLSSIIGY
jgi:hypothetical protein